MALFNASLSSLLDAVRQIEPVIKAHAMEAEQERRLSDAVVDAMRARGLYRLWCPQAFGGLEVDPIDGVPNNRGGLTDRQRGGMESAAFDRRRCLRTVVRRRRGEGDLWSAGYD